MQKLLSLTPYLQCNRSLWCSPSSQGLAPSFTALCPGLITFHNLTPGQGLFVGRARGWAAMAGRASWVVRLSCRANLLTRVCEWRQLRVPLIYLCFPARDFQGRVRLPQAALLGPGFQAAADKICRKYCPAVWKGVVHSSRSQMHGLLLKALRNSCVKV